MGGVFGNDKDTKVVGAGIRRHQEEAYLLGIVGVRGTHQFFAIAKSYLSFSATILGNQDLGFRIFAIADKIPGEENGLQVLHLHVGAFALETVLFEKKAEAVFLRGEVVDIALQTAAIEEGDYGLVPEVLTVWRLRAGPVFV